MRPAFKKIGNKLAFNNQGGEPIFIIVQELDLGYLYFLETTPFGSVNFVHKELVEVEEEVEEKVEEEPTKPTKKQYNKKSNLKKGGKAL